MSGVAPPGPPPPPPPPVGVPYAERKPVDGVSVAALVCSALCCLAPVGIGLGIAGLVRTKGGRRSGRWAAVLALVLGVVALLALTGLALLVNGTFGGTVDAEDARPGQCANSFAAMDRLVEADCDEPHDAEFVWVGTLDERAAEEANTKTTWAFCSSRTGMDPEHLHALTAGDYELGYITDADDRYDIKVGDVVACYAQASDGGTLNGSLADLHG